MLLLQLVVVLHWKTSLKIVANVVAVVARKMLSIVEMIKLVVMVVVGVVVGRKGNLRWVEGKFGRRG